LDFMSFPDTTIFPHSTTTIFPQQAGYLTRLKRWTLDRVDKWGTTAKITSLKGASYLTDPICKVREYFYSFYILNETCKTTCQKVTKIVFLSLGIAVCTVVAPFTTPMGAAIRGIVVALESKPYVYVERTGKGKVLPEDKNITLLAHNVCFMPAGYSITNGQVTPPSDKTRKRATVEEINKLNPDILCLYEVPDICDADYLSSQLTKYPFIIPVAGTRVIGPSSMMYVASKYEIVKETIQFSAFVKGTELTGEAAYSEKGYLSFEIKSRGENHPFATVISTHLQHSICPANPEESEKIARTAQMKRIAKHIQTKVNQGQAIIFTGDLNQDEEELNEFLNRHDIDCLRRDPSVKGTSTWGGDAWSSKLLKLPPSGPAVLDYTFIAGKATDISTRIIETGYSGDAFRPKALSDHNPLFSTITVT
jgi:endonuclease/exonuclease/phosphatase family metal-dependent hydrolase